MKLVTVENVNLTYKGQELEGSVVALIVAPQVLIFQEGGSLEDMAGNGGEKFRCTAENIGELEYNVLVASMAKAVEAELALDTEKVEEAIIAKLGDGAREVAENILEASEEHYNIANQMSELSTEDLLDQMYEVVRDEQEGIGQVLGDLSVLLVQAGKIVKHVGSFVEEMSDAGKDDFIETFNSPELDEYKEATVKAYSLIGDVLKYVSKYTENYGSQLDAGQSYFKKLKGNWDTAKFFGTTRTFKVQSAINKIVDIIK